MDWGLGRVQEAKEDLERENLFILRHCIQIGSLRISLCLPLGLTDRIYFSEPECPGFSMLQIQKKQRLAWPLLLFTLALHGQDGAEGVGQEPSGGHATSRMIFALSVKME